jgi:hypothetical protein
MQDQGAGLNAASNLSFPNPDPDRYQPFMTIV